MEKYPTIGFKTLGCRLNQAEEEALRRQFMENGWLVTGAHNSDFVIINSCAVTEQAMSRTNKAVRDARKINPEARIAVIGCGADAAKEIPEADLVIPNSQKKKVFKIVENLNDKISMSNKARKTEDQIGHLSLGLGHSSARTRALLKVQDGCNNFCAYCIVPHLRGRDVSVPLADVITEAKKLEELGYKELVISGVNVGRWGADLQGTIPCKGSTFAELVREILGRTSFPRIRLSSINPQDITDKLIDLWAAEPRLCRHFHLSLQSGSSSVLKRMGRPYTAEEYLKLAHKIYEKIPDMAITTDVIVGFPGETEKEFQETLALVREVKFAKLHVFRYSKRRGTRAEVMPDQVPENTKKTRSEALIKEGEILHQKFVQKFIGQEMEVLLEEQKHGEWYGLTSNYIRVKLASSEDLYNTFKNVLITKDNLA